MRVISPYRPKRIAKAPAMRWGIVGMADHSTGVGGTIRYDCTRPGGYCPPPSPSSRPNRESLLVLLGVSAYDAARPPAWRRRRRRAEATDCPDRDGPGG